jgi:outer membrane receptor protein involved in Fe transport
MENMGMVNVGAALTQTPANVSTFTPAATGNANFFTGSYISDIRGLNPYFGSRTLTLLNTRRFVQTDQGDSVDLNFIPQILVERIDVVTGGASAAYGSGAIAGVENILLNNELSIRVGHRSGAAAVAAFPRATKALSLSCLPCAAPR